jgi:integrase
MPWRKYKSKPGRYGPTYHISKGVQVRRIECGTWKIFIKKGGERKNKTIGPGRESLIKAIKIAEKIAPKVDLVCNANSPEQPKSKLPRFRKYSEDWVNENIGRWDEQTFIRYEGILRIHIWPHEVFRGKRLDEVTRADIKKRLRLLLKTHSPASVELAHTILCSIFQEAVDDEIILANPARGLLKKLLPPKRKRNVNPAEPFDIEERDRFLEYAEKKCNWPEQLILKMMVHAGFRLGEALAMRFRYLDLKKMTYYVSEGYRQQRFSTPKKGKKRFVDLPQFLAEELGCYVKDLKKKGLRNGQGGEIDLLFHDPKEEGYWPYSQRKVQMLVKRVCKGAQLRQRNPHDLRHTYASILLMANRSPAYVKEQLGHSSIMVTVDIYGHWVPGKGREGLEEALLGVVRKRHFLAPKPKTASVTT